MMRMNKTEFRKYCSDYAYLYIIKLDSESESFYKIGITSNEDIDIRLYEYKKFYEVKIIKFLKHPSPEIIMDIERLLIDSFDRYVPLIAFPGKSECVKSINELKDIFKNLKWVRDLEEIYFKEKIKKSNFGKAVKEYYEAKYYIQHKEERILTDSQFKHYENIILDFETNPDFECVLNYIELFGFDQELKDFSDGYLRESNIKKKVEQEYEKRRFIEIAKNQFKISEYYSNNNIKYIFKEIMNKFNIKYKASINDLNLIFETQKTTKNKENCLKIISLK